MAALSLRVVVPLLLVEVVPLLLTPSSPALSSGETLVTADKDDNNDTISVTIWQYQNSYIRLSLLGNS